MRALSNNFLSRMYFKKEVKRTKKIASLFFALLFIVSFFALSIKEVRAENAPIYMSIGMADDNGQWLYTASATAYYYPNYQGSGIDYLGITIGVTYWSAYLFPAYGLIDLMVGQEFTVLDSNMYHYQDSILWWEDNYWPTWGQGTVCYSTPGYQWYYSGSYYIIAQRIDYNSQECWLQLQGSILWDPAYGAFTDHDWHSLDLT